MAENPARVPRPVPWRTIVATIAAVLVTVIGIELVLSLQRILTWCIVAGFFAVVLNPLVDFLVYRPQAARRSFRVFRTETGFRVTGKPPEPEQLSLLA